MKKGLGLTHLYRPGLPAMVDVSRKSETVRTASAEASVRLTPKSLRALRSALKNKGRLAKGDPFSVAVIAGIQAAKRTSQLIPLCHPIRIESVRVEPRLSGSRARFCVTCVTTDRTGIEMEAMVGASVAALAFYDMLKSSDRGIVIERVRLLKKTGGKSGTFEAGV